MCAGFYDRCSCNLARTFSPSSTSHNACTTLSTSSLTACLYPINSIIVAALGNPSNESAFLTGYDGRIDRPLTAETLPDFTPAGWLALVAPVGTPELIVQKLSDDLRARPYSIRLPGPIWKQPATTPIR